MYYLNLVLSFLASLLRFGVGAQKTAVRDHEPIILYEFEGCPYCRVAREAFSEAGVTALVRPCPKGGKRFRPMVKAQGGKAQFPYIVDSNGDRETRLYESADISRYLAQTYGRGQRVFLHNFGPINQILSQFATLARLLAGMFSAKSIAPQKPLEFYGAERDPRARLVKELLCVLELEYLWRPAESGAPAPRLVDPNVGADIVGAPAIRRHLKANYRP